MFKGCTSLVVFNGQIIVGEQSTKFKGTVDLSHMFEGCTSLTTFGCENITENVLYIKSNNDITLDEMFNGCTSLSIVKSKFIVSNIDTDINDVTISAKNLFTGCTYSDGIKFAEANFNIQSRASIDMTEAFSSLKIKSLPSDYRNFIIGRTTVEDPITINTTLTGFFKETNFVDPMIVHMTISSNNLLDVSEFAMDSTNLEELDIIWHISNGNELKFDKMCYNCSLLSSFTWFDVSQVSPTTCQSLSCKEMFYQCTGLKEFAFNSARATTGNIDYSNMFEGCTALEKMTWYCNTVADQGSINCSNMFLNCTNMVGKDKSQNIIELKGFSANKGINLTNMLKHCPGILEVTIDSLNNIDYDTNTDTNIVATGNIDISNIMELETLDVTNVSKFKIDGGDIKSNGGDLVMNELFKNRTMTSIEIINASGSEITCTGDVNMSNMLNNSRNKGLTFILPTKITASNVNMSNMCSNVGGKISTMTVVLPEIAASSGSVNLSNMFGLNTECASITIKNISAASLDMSNFAPEMRTILTVPETLPNVITFTNAFDKTVEDKKVYTLSTIVGPVAHVLVNTGNQTASLSYGTNTYSFGEYKSTSDAGNTRTVVINYEGLRNLEEFEDYCHRNYTATPDEEEPGKYILTFNINNVDILSPQPSSSSGERIYVKNVHLPPGYTSDNVSEVHWVFNNVTFDLGMPEMFKDTTLTTKVQFVDCKYGKNQPSIDSDGFFYQTFAVTSSGSSNKKIRYIEFTSSNDDLAPIQTNMIGTFSGVTELTTLDLHILDASECSEFKMDQMCYGCTNLTSLKLPKLPLQVTDVSLTEVCKDCTKLKHVYNFYASTDEIEATSAPVQFSCVKMFNQCKDLEYVTSELSIPDGEEPEYSVDMPIINLGAGNVYMTKMFNETKIKSIRLNNITTSTGEIKLERLVSGCYYLEKITCEDGTTIKTTGAADIILDELADKDEDGTYQYLEAKLPIIESGNDVSLKSIFKERNIYAAEFNSITAAGTVNLAGLFQSTQFGNGTPDTQVKFASITADIIDGGYDADNATKPMFDMVAFSDANKNNVEIGNLTAVSKINFVSLCNNCNSSGKIKKFKLGNITTTSTETVDGILMNNMLSENNAIESIIIGDINATTPVNLTSALESINGTEPEITVGKIIQTGGKFVTLKNMLRGSNVHKVTLGTANSPLALVVSNTHVSLEGLFENVTIDNDELDIGSITVAYAHDMGTEYLLNLENFAHNFTGISFKAPNIIVSNDPTEDEDCETIESGSSQYRKFMDYRYINTEHMFQGINVQKLDISQIDFYPADLKYGFDGKVITSTTRNPCEMFINLNTTSIGEMVLMEKDTYFFNVNANGEDISDPTVTNKNVAGVRGKLRYYKTQATSLTDAQATFDKFVNLNRDYATSESNIEHVIYNGNIPDDYISNISKFLSYCNNYHNYTLEDNLCTITFSGSGSTQLVLGYLNDNSKIQLGSYYENLKYTRTTAGESGDETVDVTEPGSKKAEECLPYFYEVADIHYAFVFNNIRVLKTMTALFASTSKVMSVEFKNNCELNTFIEVPTTSGVEYFTENFSVLNRLCDGSKVESLIIDCDLIDTGNNDSIASNCPKLNEFTLKGYYPVNSCATLKSLLQNSGTDLNTDPMEYINVSLPKDIKKYTGKDYKFPVIISSAFEGARVKTIAMPNIQFTELYQNTALDMSNLFKNSTIEGITFNEFTHPGVEFDYIAGDEAIKIDGLVDNSDNTILQMIVLREENALSHNITEHLTIQIPYRSDGEHQSVTYQTTQIITNSRTAENYVRCYFNDAVQSIQTIEDFTTYCKSEGVKAYDTDYGCEVITFSDVAIDAFNKTSIQIAGYEDDVCNGSSAVILKFDDCRLKTGIEYMFKNTNAKIKGVIITNNCHVEESTAVIDEDGNIESGFDPLEQAFIGSQIQLIKFEKEIVTVTGKELFKGCTQLKSFPENLKFSNPYFQSICEGCTSMTASVIPTLTNTASANLTTYKGSRMYYGSGIKNAIVIPNITVNGVLDLSYAFSHCTLTSGNDYATIGQLTAYGINLTSIFEETPLTSCNIRGLEGKYSGNGYVFMSNMLKLSTAKLQTLTVGYIYGDEVSSDAMLSGNTSELEILSGYTATAYKSDTITYDDTDKKASILCYTVNADPTPIQIDKQYVNAYRGWKQITIDYTGNLTRKITDANSMVESMYMNLPMDGSNVIVLEGYEIDNTGGVIRIKDADNGNGDADIVQAMKELGYSTGNYEMEFINCKFTNGLSELFEDITHIERVKFNGNYDEEGGKCVYNANAFKKAFYNCTSLTGIEFINDVIIEQQSDASEMCYNCSSLSTIDLSQLEFVNDINMSSAFENCHSLVTFKSPNFSPDITNYINLSRMFMNCDQLGNYTPNPNSIIQGVSNGVNLSNMFTRCTALKYFNNSSTSQFTEIKASSANLTQMFSDCISLRTIDMSNSELSGNILISEMFSGCVSLKSTMKLPTISTTNDSDVNMSRTFYSCSSLESFTLEDVSLDGLINMEYMFAGCGSLQSFVFPTFATDNRGINMYRTFYNCHELRTANLPEQLLSNGEIKLYETFRDCGFTDRYDVPTIRASATSSIDLSKMFRECREMVNLYIDPTDSSISGGNITLYKFFNKCYKLNRLYSNENTLEQGDAHIDPDTGETVYSYKLNLPSNTAANKATYDIPYYVADSGIDGSYKWIEFQEHGEDPGEEEEEDPEDPDPPVPIDPTIIDDLEKLKNYMSDPSHYYIASVKGKKVVIINFDNCRIVSDPSNPLRFSDIDQSEWPKPSPLPPDWEPNYRFNFMTTEFPNGLPELFMSAENVSTINIANSCILGNEGENEFRQTFADCRDLVSLTIAMKGTVHKANGILSDTAQIKSIDLSALTLTGYASLENACYNCKSLESFVWPKLKDLSYLDTTQMFYGCTSLTEMDVPDLTVSNIVKSERMFSNSGVEVVHVQSMTGDSISLSRMFENVPSLKTILIDEVTFSDNNIDTTDIIKGSGNIEEFRIPKTICEYDFNTNKLYFKTGDTKTESPLSVMKCIMDKDVYIIYFQYNEPPSTRDMTKVIEGISLVRTMHILSRLRYLQEVVKTIKDPRIKSAIEQEITILEESIKYMERRGLLAHIHEYLPRIKKGE